MRIFDYELLKNFSFSSEIMSFVSQIREMMGRQNHFINQRKDELEKLVETAKIQSTEASNKIEGIITTDKRLAELFQSKTTPINRAEEEILGYYDALNTIHENYEKVPIKPSYILEFHRDLYSYSRDFIGGKYKSTDNIILEIDDHGNKFIRFQPLSAFLTPTPLIAFVKNT